VVKGLDTADSIHNLGGGLNPNNSADRALINNRTFLVAFAKQFIDERANQADHATPEVTAATTGISS
jgi:hypothetical protein